MTDARRWLISETDRPNNQYHVLASILDTGCCLLVTRSRVRSGAEQPVVLTALHDVSRPAHCVQGPNIQHVHRLHTAPQPPMVHHLSLAQHEQAHGYLPRSGCGMCTAIKTEGDGSLSTTDAHTFHRRSPASASRSACVAAASPAHSYRRPGARRKARPRISISTRMSSSYHGDA